MADTQYNDTQSFHEAILNEICIGHDKLQDLIHLQHKRTVQLQG